MFSTDHGRTLTRRQLLAVCGSCLGVGALGGYAYGSGYVRGDDCNPTPLDTSPTDWPLPGYDGGNTRAVPSGRAPASGLSERWRIRLQNPEQPLAINGSVFVAPETPSAEFVRSYELSTGEEQWAKPVSPSGYSLPLLAGGDSLFLGQDRASGETVSRALATADGSERWTSGVASGHVVPVFGAGLLVFRDSPALIAIDARTGEECWRESVASNLRSGAIHAGETVVVDTGTDGKIIALDARTGEQQWKFDVSDYFHPDEDDIVDARYGRIVAGTDRLFFRTYGGMSIALDAVTGETDWVTPETPPEMPAEGGRNYIPPGLEPIAFSSDVLVVVESDGTDRSDSLHALDPTTGSERWSFEPEAEEDVHIRSAAVAGETVFLPVLDELQLLDLSSGSVLETHDLDGYARSISLAEGACLVATTEGIVAFE
ncbi:quinohemoprotein alcohol dehydrogenase [Natronococcus amylolyticus DSM 10524]|uniref:Quinohemoprotein alcohol dehydrogenase n=1 Tax=Natronococcus amylolyticus DSM 10524 TaxID=1227497 RepID=L9XC31_9EURY|nr:PQQ-binding-like beta-propeller repeat protein [Natronococcus amylolyticus]ELY59192.1 quinohemoprotein alcohol dehydrogenase [Natronococcus amylolyticus DSM 10524]